MTPSVCIANIGPRGRRRRMRVGVVLLVLGGVAAFFLLQSHAPRLWRVALFLPFWVGGLGLFQATGRT